MRQARVVAVVVAAVLGAGAASSSAGAAVTARGSVGEAYVLGAKKGDRLSLLDRGGRVLTTARADRFGSKIFRDVASGRGYTVRLPGGAATKRFAVLAPDENPPASLYRRAKLKAGLNYVKMRDGVELAMTVRLPPGKTLDDGPLPTIIEYSGYQVAAPKDLLSALGDPTDPLVPATSTFVGSVIGPQLGFAVVSVQMRGSGCSGGDFDLFDLPTTYDGYDAVESVAAQPWVKGHKVGLAGISFSGISQLFVGGARPPHLAAIAPLSVFDDLYEEGYPGGIFNTGFIRSWLEERLADAQPAPDGGQPYARALVKAGDAHCTANQRLRLQTQNVLEITSRNPYRVPALTTARSPATWMGRIDVPTFLVGQFQDEQTGGHFIESLGRLAKNPKVWITLQNGVHPDSLGPSTITRWFEFLKLYVADEVPKVPSSILGLSSALYRLIADADAAPVRQSRFADTTDVAADRRIFERDPRVRLLMDNGAGPTGPGTIGATWELGFDAWPVRQAKPTTYYLDKGGALRATKPSSAGAASYVPDPGARPKQTLPGSGSEDAWKAQPPYDWTPLAAGKGLGFTSQALKRDVVIAGPSSLDVLLKSSARDTDLQVTLSEVRPDGNETYIQNGWLRASHRKLDPRRSTALDPVPTHLAKDAAPLPRGAYAPVRVPIYPVAHAFRAGSRIRVTIEATGGDRPRWDFGTVDKGTTRNTIALGGNGASKLVLPVVVGADAKGTPLPGPTALRGEPSRVYKAASNGG